MNSVGADTSDPVILNKYVTAWQGYDEERKAKISSNLKVIVALEELQAARRIEKKTKTAVDDDSLLDL